MRPFQLALPARTADVTTQSFVFDGASRTYSLYVPDTLDGTPATLLVMLHGSWAFPRAHSLDQDPVFISFGP